MAATATELAVAVAVPASVDERGSGPRRGSHRSTPRSRLTCTLVRSGRRTQM